MKLDKKLEPFRKELEKTSDQKVFLLNCIADSCDTIQRHPKPKGRTLWKFYFDDGVYKGGWWLQINQNNLKPLAVVELLVEIPWPGLKCMKDQMQKPALRVLRGNYAKYVQEESQ